MPVRGSIVQVSSSFGGVPKLPMQEAVVGPLGIEGDYHADVLNHGGPARALCLFAMENIEAMQAEGHPIAPGTTGENVTTRGIDWAQVAPGTVMRLGPEVVIEITNYTTPCRTIEQSFSDRNFNRMHQRVNPGNSRVYAGVLQGGTIRPGDTIELYREEELDALEAEASEAVEG
jgi:MOSC domain-containing protein YiiM